MGKVKYTIFSLILCVLFAPLFVACGQGVPLNGISPAKAKYSVLQGQQVQLELIYAPAEATNKLVTYSILKGSEYATVDQNGLLSALVVDDKSAHDVQVVATADYSSTIKAMFTVKILANKIVLDSPHGLGYDNNTKSIVWDEVVFKDNPENAVVIPDYKPCYALAIASGDVTDITLAQQFDVGRENTYAFGKTAFAESGTYTVWVKSVSDDTETFVDSDFSQRFVFTVLDRPQDIEIKNYEIITPKVNMPGFSSTMDNYVLSIKNNKIDAWLDATTLSGFVKSEKVIEGRACVCWSIPHTNIGEDFGVGEFLASIKIVGDGQRFFDTVEDGTKLFYQLGTPTNVALMENVVVWDEVEFANRYEVLVITYSEVEGVKTPSVFATLETDENRCTLSSEIMALSEKTITVKAKGNGQEKLDGKEVLVDSIKLTKVANLTATLSGSDTVLSWDADSEAGGYQILFNNEEKTFTTANSFSFNDSNMNFVDGINTISVVKKPKDEISVDGKRYLDSDEEKLLFTKLVNPELYTQNGQIAWNAVNGAFGYEIELVYNVQAVNPVTGDPETKQMNPRISLSAAETSFSIDNATALEKLTGEARNYGFPSGEYKAFVRALGNDVLVRSSKEFTTEEKNNAIPFIKQAAPQGLKINGEGYLSWNSETSGPISSECDFIISVHSVEAGASGDDIEIRIPSNKTGESLNSYLSAVGFGEYVFSVRVVNNKQALRFLNSEESERVGFYRLMAPTGLAVSNGGFEWDALDTTITEINAQISDKFMYVLKLTGGITVNVDQHDNIGNEITTYELLQTECNEGQNTVSIKAEVRPDLGDNNVIEINGSRLYLLSSGFSSSLSFVKLPAPSTPEINGDFLRGLAVDGAESYTLQITNAVGSSISTIVTNVQDGYWLAPYGSLMDSVDGNGAITVSVSANGGDDFVNSNMSRIPLGLFRMNSPTVEIDNNVHQIVWNDISATVNMATTFASSYLVSYKKNVDGSDWVNDIVFDNTWFVKDLPEGEYKFKVKALSDRQDVLPSPYSSEFTFAKLKTVNYSTIAVKDEYPFNKITWNRVYSGDPTKVDFLVSVYQRLDSGELKLVQTKVVEDAGIDANNGDADINPEFVFDNSLRLEQYEISIEAISEDYVRSGAPDSNFIVNRLARPTNLSVSLKNEAYKLSWVDLNGSGNYAIKSNNVSVFDSVDIFDAVEDNKYTISIGDSLDAGSQRIVVQAIYNGALTQSANAVTISSPESKEYLAVKLSSPVVTVSNGLIRWVDTNNTKFGYELEFVYVDDDNYKVKVDLDKNAMTYDMNHSDISPGMSFVLKMKAKGNGDNYIDSDIYDGFKYGSEEIQLERLSVPTGYVENGVIKWKGVDHASSYTAVVFEEGKENNKYTQRDISSYQEEGADKVYQMPQAPLNGKVGKIVYRLQAVGTPSADAAKVYINSLEADDKYVQKWNKPTGLRIENGEIDWNRISEQETTDMGRYIFSNYKVSFGDNTTTVGREQPFILSSFVTERETMNVKVCCVGTWEKTTYDGAWINSDYTSDFLVTIAGKPELSAEGGILSWKESSQDSYYYDDYELYVELSSAERYNIKINANSTLLTLNTFGALSGYTQENLQAIERIDEVLNISSVKIRHKGLALSTTSQYGNYVNSGYSTAITNIHKLQKASDMFVNDEGKLQWKQADSDDDVVIVIKGQEFTKTASNFAWDSNDNTATLDFSEETFTADSDFAVRISYHTQRASSSTDVFLVSEEDSISAYRFSKVVSIGRSDGNLKLAWEYKDETSTASNDKFIVKYKFIKAGDEVDFTDDSLTEYEKVFEREDLEIVDKGDGNMVASVPFWGVGSYLISIRVSSTSLNVIPSEIVTSEVLKFDKFYGGNGTMDYPFIIQNITRDSFYSDNISATDQFYFIKKMPQLYYSLGQDIVLYDRDTLHTNMQVSSETLVSNFLFSEEEYGSVVLTGGIYGNGKVVSNYQIYDKSFASSLFYYIQGDEVEDATTANNFFGRRGVINNMKLEVSRFDYNNYYKDIAFFATKAYGAWIVDCEVGLSSTSFPNGLEIIPTTSSNILYGGFVAHLYSEVPSDEEFIKYDAYEVKDRKARIIGCVSNVDITIRFNQQEYLQNSNTRMGGIVGSMYGASIINCTNAGKLGGSQVGGIVNSTYDVNVESDISWANVISGCANRANLVSYATKVYGSATGTMCNSGGIISYCGGSNTYVVNCLQTEVLTVLNGNYEANPLNATAVIAAIGGIVGNKGGNIIMVNCLNLNKISYDGEGEIVQRVLASGSVFCGLSAVSLTAVGGSYYLSTAGCNYTNGVAGSQESFDVGETDLKQNANMTFVSLGTINNADSTISNLIVEFSYPGDESKKIKTNLLYEPLISQINLFYFDGTNYPTLRTYTII